MDYRYDLVCIGSGPAGQRAAVQASKLGKKVALVEKSSCVGGICLHTGTIPSKTFREAVLKQSVKTKVNNIHGITEKSLEQIFQDVQIIIDKEVLVNNDQLSRNDVHVFHGEAAFLNPNEILVKSKKQNIKLQSEFFLISVGASAIKPISSFRKNKSLQSTCSKILNLGINGAVIEDYIVLSQSILENQKKTKNIIIQINAWTFNFNRDSRWLRYKNDYNRALKNMIFENNNNYITNKTTTSYQTLLIKNLINIKYFISSLNLINSKKNYSIELAKDFNFELGTTHKVLLPDGSIISSAETIEERKKNKKDLSKKREWNMQNWGIVPGVWYEKNAINIFIKLVNQLKKNFNVIFLITPYHPDVWSNEEQPSIKAMKNVELKANEIAKILNVDVIGSFNPEKVGCYSNEFMDEIHATDLCLSKLENVYVSN